MTKVVDYKKLPKAPYKPLAEVARRVAADGCVLLKNDGNILPLNKSNVISLFGRTQIDYNKSGTGSGGLVRTDYVVNILDGIRNNEDLTLNEELVKVYESWLLENPFDTGAGWAQEPWCQVEMVPDEKTLIEAREKSDVAVVVIGRTAGEDKDNSCDKGSWYLTDEEEALLCGVSKHFDKTVVLLNVGNIIDMQWVEKYNIMSVMYVWQGGQEGGNAVADILSGKVNPSGRLTDTIARDITLYPSVKNFGNKDFNIYEEDIYVGYRYFETFAKNDVLYPFGFGLSYTTFDKNIKNVSKNGDKIRFDVDVKNVGEYSGRDVVQVYFEASQGKLGKSARELCAFLKTKELSKNETETLHFELDINSMCAYDDSGVTGNKSCYVLEAGEYNIYAGCCVRCAEKIYSFNIEDLKVIKECEEVMAPQREFNVMHPQSNGEEYVVTYKPVSKRTVDNQQRIKSNLPKEIEQTGDKDIKLIDVKENKNTLEEFVAQLSDKDLMCIILGEGMCSPKVRPGSAGAVGGVTESLMSFGIPVASLHDGPSGIRMDSGEHATSLPNGTAVASTWDASIAEEIYENLSIELCINKVDSILGPGINIHRSPLNGRNFEYLSEDPYLSGKIGAALIRGVRKYGNSATVKHFAANSQETNRYECDSVLSERALREIYLKTFEYAIIEGDATSIMTGYNLLNGEWCANNYDLNTTVLRKEWGYKGYVVTDWWTRLMWGETECKNLKDMVAAQNDVYMPTPDALTFNSNLSKALENGLITRGQLQRNAMNILRYLLGSHSLTRFVNEEDKPLKSLLSSVDTLNNVLVLECPENEKEYEFEIDVGGHMLLGVEYTSSQNEIAQMVITVFINNVSASSITVNGTKGENKTVYRDVSVAMGGKIVVKYPDELLQVKKIELKK